VTPNVPLIVAASTHDSEETWLLEALRGLATNVRMLIAPRHPERFDDVARSIERSGLSFVRRTSDPSECDRSAKVILLDSIGELRAVYPLAEIVFVGGSLIKHGGQSILEPAAAAKAIVTGPYTQNFEAVIKEFLEADAILQIPPISDNSSFSDKLRDHFHTLLNDAELRNRLGRNASSLMQTNDRGATSKTIELLRPLIAGKLA
jgi:3-deoxy-D-manno-octulosonic-acid transferase